MKYDLEHLSYTKCNQLLDELETVLNRKDVRCFSLHRIIKDWYMFCTEPTKYSNTVVVDLVNHYLDAEFAKTKNYKGKLSHGAQSVMLDDVI